eukprot:1344586-Amphidinium_carterae.1
MEQTAVGSNATTNAPFLNEREGDQCDPCTGTGLKGAAGQLKSDAHSLQPASAPPELKAADREMEGLGLEPHCRLSEGCTSA